MKGVWTPCPNEEFHYSYSSTNPVAPGYSGCVSEDDAKPCGWYDYYTYDPITGSCAKTATMGTALQTVRGGSPTMTKDMLRLTGGNLNPTVTFAAMPMAYPAGRDNGLPEIAELETTWKKFMTYFGSQLDFTDFNGWPTYGAEQGMVMSVGIKILELASTTCNRDFYAYLEAPAYGYDWSQAVTWAEQRSSSFYAGSECPCASTSTCNSKGTVTLSQVGWAPARYPALPSKAAYDGTMYSADSTAANSPWIQTNVIPGNPIGRMNDCKVPADRCLCDGVYWYPGFTAPGTVLKDFKCYSWAFSITKVYSAQLRGGIMFVKKTPASAQSAASRIVSKALSMANGLYSYMQLHGQIQLMNKIMATPYATSTSWLNAMGQAQREKWDLMWDAYATCEAAGVAKITAETVKYNGAYILGHMMEKYYGYSNDIGAASSDFFKNVIGYDHFNYNWGWRGEDPKNYGIGNITKYDFHRTHLFRATEVYAEEARRMKLVCGNFNARVASSFMTFNEWVTVRAADIQSRRRLDEPVSHHARALEIMKAAPAIDLVNAIKMAQANDPNRETAWEYGMPSEWA